MSTPVNGPLNAAIAALNAQPYPWFAPAYSIRLTDKTVYDSLVTTYGFGTNIVMGLSPNDAAVLTGVPIVTDPSFASQQIRPEIFVHPDALNVLGVPITLAESGGTIAISYAGPFGRFDRVVWEWQCEVTFDPAVVAASGGWDQAVFTYTGTGVDGTLVPTPFDLTVGVVAVWVFPQLSFIASYRHNDPAMLGTIMSAPFSTVDTVGGIKTFEAGGFTVADHAARAVWCNELGEQYTAIVLRDSTSDNRYLKVGQYTGNDSTQSIVSGFAVDPTALWIFGRASTIVFCSDQFAAPNSVSFELEAKSLTNQITSLAASFSVGSDNNVNASAVPLYYFAAFQIPVGDTVRGAFNWYRVTGTGVDFDVNVGFEPAFATARPFVAGIPDAVWRSPLHVGRDCTDFDSVSQADGGIVAFTADGITLGTTAAAPGTDVYGFAFKATFSGGGPAGPPYNPDPPAGYIPSGGLISQGLGTGQLGPCGCPLETPE